MSKAAFLAEIEPLPHRARVLRAVALGRRAASGDAEAGHVIEALRVSPEAWERLLAITTVYATRDGARVVEALADPSRTVRRAACRVVAIACDDAQAKEALGRIRERRALRRVVAHLGRRGRRDVVDSWFAERAEAEHVRELVDLLTLGSQELVLRFLAPIEELGGEVVWERLARHHPRVFAHLLLAEIDKTGRVGPRTRLRIAPRLRTLAERAPDLAVALVKKLFEAGEEPRIDAMATLVRKCPCETFDLVRARHEAGRPAPPPGAFAGLDFDKVAHRLGPERLAWLVRNAWSTLSDEQRGRRWFLRLSAQDREGVVRAFLWGGRGAWGAFLFRYAGQEDAALREQAFERWRRAAQDQNGCIAASFLALLPRDLREREAHRHLEAVPWLASSPAVRAWYAGLLPYAEAKQVLAPLLGHPKGEERAHAQSILIGSVANDREAIGEALADVKARRFEQDPVRGAMIGALANLPVACFRAEHLETVGGILQDTLDAADLSDSTAGNLELWVARLLRIDGAWGAGWLAKDFAVRGDVSVWGLADGLTKGQVEALSRALAPVVAAWTNTERAPALTSLAACLANRLRLFEPVLDALERLAREIPIDYVVGTALGLLREAAPARFARLVPELLALDKSFVLLESVTRHVSVHRQDLLPGLIEAAPMTGRFASGRTHWVLDFKAGHARWTPAQQRTYAQGLAALLRDPERDVPTLSFAVRTLARLAYADPAPVLAAAADPRPPVLELAIRCLPWLDAGQGVRTVMEALGDERARWAIQALGKLRFEMPRADVLAALQAVPAKQVTVAKEVARLLGVLGGPEAYEELLKRDAPGTHRDVRIAMLRALWDHLDEPRTWDVFGRALTGPDWILASKLAQVPVGRLSYEAEAHVAALLASLLGRPEPEARVDVIRRAPSLPIRDPDGVFFDRLVEHTGVDSPDESAAAVTAVLARVPPASFVPVAHQLSTLIPRRRHLVAMLPALQAVLGPYARLVHRQLAHDLLDFLCEDTATTTLYLSLGARVWSAEELAAELVDLAARDLLHYDAMRAAIAAVEACATPAALDAALQPQADPRLRRLGLAALVRSAEPPEGWTDERRARLDLYRSDPSPGVSGPASFVFPP